MPANAPTPSAGLEGAVLVVLSGLSFGTLSVFNRQLGQAGVSVPMMLAVRFFGGAVVLWTLALARGDRTRLTLRRWLAFVALGVLYVGGSWAYFESATRIPVALTALLMYAYPGVVAVARWMLQRESLGVRGAVALGLSSIGIALAVGSPSGPIDALGVGLGLATALIYTAYVLVGARVQPGVSPLVGSAWLMTIAAGLFTLGAAGTHSWDLQRCSEHWVPLSGLIVLGTALPVPLLLAGLARVGATRGAILSSAEPISAAACGALFLGEALSWLQLAGAGLVLVALGLLAVQGPRSQIGTSRPSDEPQLPRDPRLIGDSSIAPRSPHRSFWRRILK